MTKGRTSESREEPDGLDTALNPTGGAFLSASSSAASPGRGQGFTCCRLNLEGEPPRADPHAGWCGGREGEPPGYPLGLQRSASTLVSHPADWLR